MALFFLVAPSLWPTHDTAFAQESTASEIDRLIDVLNDDGTFVRRNAAVALGEIGEAAVPALINALKDEEDVVLQRGAADALGRMGKKAEAAIPALVDAMRDEDEFLHVRAALALEMVGEAAIPALIDALKDEDEGVQERAAESLGRMGKKAEAAIPALLDALKDEDEGLQLTAALALATIGEEVEAAVPVLIDALKDEDEGVQRNAADALGRIGKNAEAAIPALIDALKAEDWVVRRKAVDVLGNFGEKAEAAVPALINALKADERSQLSATIALRKIATSLRDASKTSSLGILTQVHEAFKELDDPAAEELRRHIEYLEQLWWKELLGWAAANKGWLALVAIFPLWLAVCLVTFWRSPGALLTVNDKLRPHEYEIFGLKFPLRHLLIVGFFNYHPRLLDAWIAGHADQARENFAGKRTVADRSIHIPIPVELSGSTVAELRGRDLSSVFTKGSGLLLIWGEGGAGKTSIACQIARWGMAEEPEQRATQHLILPVLIEDELKGDFIAAIRGGLQRLIEKPGAPLPPVPEHLFQELLKQRRVLVIVDHLSEMSAETRELVQPNMPDFPIGALIVTSRIEEKLGKVPKKTLKPMRVTGDYLFEFMGAYLRALGVRELFPDRKFGDAGGRISDLVGDRQVTVLLVKLFLDQMIRRAKRSEEGQDALPQNIPDLMLSYVYDINESIPDEERRDHLAVHKDSQAVAWACLQESFRPASTDIDDDVLPLLTAIEKENAKERLTYLDERLHLIETIEPGFDKVRYLLDPLAEYLAGLHLVGSYRDDEEKWREVLVKADAMEGGLDAIRGFLLAVHDCCLAKQKDEAIPEKIIAEFAKRAEFAPEAIERAQQRQRVAHHMRGLKAGDAGDRALAALTLGEIGGKAEAAIPALIEVLKDEDAYVRSRAAGALGSFYGKAEAVVPALIDALKDEDKNVRESAADTLGRFGEKAEAAVPALIDALKDEDADVRQCAAYVLSRIGEKAEAAVPHLIEALTDENWPVRANAADTLKEIAPDYDRTSKKSKTRTKN